VLHLSGPEHELHAILAWVFLAARVAYVPPMLGLRPGRLADLGNWPWRDSADGAGRALLNLPIA